ncbi:hypothetical protein HRbin15_01001 [bacterium HR15]|nr:hypothetical protein HRbin15_01001 [bacterium HR15]
MIAVIYRITDLSRRRGSATETYTGGRVFEKFVGVGYPKPYETHLPTTTHPHHFAGGHPLRPRPTLMSSGVASGTVLVGNRL